MEELDFMMEPWSVFFKLEWRALFSTIVLTIFDSIQPTTDVKWQWAWHSRRQNWNACSQSTRHVFHKVDQLTRNFCLPHKPVGHKSFTWLNKKETGWSATGSTSSALLEKNSVEAQKSQNKGNKARGIDWAWESSYVATATAREGTKESMFNQHPTTCARNSWHCENKGAVRVIADHSDE